MGYKRRKKYILRSCFRTFMTVHGKKKNVGIKACECPTTRSA